MQLKSVTYILCFSVLFLFASCSTEEGMHEQMVNLAEVKDNPEAQLSHLNEAINQSKKDGSLYARRAVLLLKKGELDKALKDADEAVRLSKNDPYSMFIKAQVLRALGNTKEALPLALKAERNSYQSSSLYVLLGELYFKQKNYSQAKTYLNKAQQLMPNDEFAFYLKGKVAEATGDTVKAVNNYLAALKQAPDFGHVHRDLAGILLTQGKFENAKPHISKAMSELKQDGLLWYYKGLWFQSVQKQDSARLAFTKAVALNDTLQQAHYKLGVIEYTSGDSEIALRNLLRAYESYKNTPRYLSLLAGAYERTAQPDKALQMYRKLLEVEPRHSYAQQAIARLTYRLSRPSTDSIQVEQLEVEQ